MRGTKRSNCYLIGRYSSGSRTPTGRGTKGYVAFDIDHGTLVFMKDYWVASDSFSELDAYRLLAKHQVRCVPTVIAGGRVRNQVTTSQKCYVKTGKRTNIPAERYHLRIIIKEVCRSLWTYANGTHLVDVMYQALIGMRMLQRSKVLNLIALTF